MDSLRVRQSMAAFVLIVDVKHGRADDVLFAAGLLI